MRPLRAHLLTLLTAAALAVGVGALSVGPAGGAPARHRQVRAVITFAKNRAHPDDSTLSWRLDRWREGRWRTTDEASWRAGSGMLGRRGTNPCIHDVGWLPNGTYHVRQYVDYPGALIKGRAFRLDDKSCPNGTVRHNLFIHTEQGAHDVQCPNRPGDQPCRWEFPRIDDYKSHGCIKLSPWALARLVDHFHKAFRPGVRYPKAAVELVVE